MASEIPFELKNVISKIEKKELIEIEVQHEV